MIKTRSLLAVAVAGVAMLLVTVMGTRLSYSASIPASQSLEGAWVVQVGQAARPAYFTYGREGNIILVSPVGRVGIGRWVKTGDREFALTFYFQDSDTAGKPTGWTKIRSTVKLDESGNAWSGPAKRDVFDTDGKLIRSDDTTHRGTRMSVEPMK